MATVRAPVRTGRRNVTPTWWSFAGLLKLCPGFHEAFGHIDLRPALRAGDEEPFQESHFGGDVHLACASMIAACSVYHGGGDQPLARASRSALSMHSISSTIASSVRRPAELLDVLNPFNEISSANQSFGLDVRVGPAVGQALPP